MVNLIRSGGANLPVLVSAPESGSLSERVYSTVRERILRGQLRPGTTLSRRELAKELGMSLLPVSAALQRLENDGLIETKPRVGTRIRVPTLQDIRENFVIREALESQSVRLFAEKATFEDRQELRRMAEHVDILFNHASSGDTDSEFLFAVYSYHFQLHMRVAECAGCRALHEIIERNHILHFSWLYEFWMYDALARLPPLPSRFHRDLVEVVTRNDPEAADGAMRHHIRFNFERLQRSMELNAGLLR